MRAMPPDFITDELPDSLQALPQFKSLTQHVIAYEGIIKESTYKEFKGQVAVCTAMVFMGS